MTEQQVTTQKMIQRQATGNHRVPDEVKAKTAITLRATTGLVGLPDDAERSRTLLAGAHFGSLATMSVEQVGFPFGSLVGYAADASGNPLMCLSDIAEHSRNVSANRQGSLMVTADDARPGNTGDPLAGARVTLLGEIVVLEGTERDEALERYLEIHPGAFYAAFHDFRLYRLEVATIRYVGGFGRMSWVSREAYAAAEVDPLLPHAGRIIEHMNADHADALVTYCTVFGKLTDTVGATLAGVDRYGLDILAVVGESGERRAVRVGFAARADTSEAVRAEVVALLRQARATPV